MTRLEIDATDAELRAILAMLVRATNEHHAITENSIATRDDQRPWVAKHRPDELADHDARQAKDVAELGLIRRFREHVLAAVSEPTGA